MKYKLINKRNKIIKKVWEIYKGEFSMEELAEVFSIPLSSFYRILKEEIKRSKTNLE